MAILYSKNRKAAETPSDKGFDLVLTDGTTYDLDYLARNKGRSNSDAELLLRIIDDKEIRAKVLEEIMATVRTSVSEVINTEEVQRHISELIAATVSAYGLTTYEEIPDQVYDIVNRHVDKYLREVFDAYGIHYKVLAFDANRADIRYTLTTSGDVPGGIEQLVNERLDLYLAKYKGELLDVEEGSLSITNVGRRRTVGTEDYKKYLLGEEFGQEKSSQGYTPNVTSRRPVIIWENGTEDTTDDGEEAIDVYASIEELNTLLADHAIKINGTLSDLSKFQFKDVIITDLEDYIAPYSYNKVDVCRLEGFTSIGEYILLINN